MKNTILSIISILLMTLITSSFALEIEIPYKCKLFDAGVKRQMYEVPCKDGLVHGILVEYYPSSKDVRNLKYFENGKRKGTWMNYYPDGRLLSKTIHKSDGTRESYMYDKAGMLTLSVKDGVVKEYYFNGMLKYERQPEAGDTVKVFNPVGKLMGFSIVLKGSSPYMKNNEGKGMCTDGRVLASVENCIGEKSDIQEFHEGK